MEGESIKKPVFLGPWPAGKNGRFDSKEERGG